MRGLLRGVSGSVRVGLGCCSGFFDVVEVEVVEANVSGEDGFGSLLDNPNSKIAMIAASIPEPIRITPVLLFFADLKAGWRGSPCG